MCFIQWPGYGAPFVNAIELRPMPSASYALSAQQGSRNVLQLFWRLHCGGPRVPYDLTAFDYRWGTAHRPCLVLRLTPPPSPGKVLVLDPPSIPPHAHISQRPPFPLGFQFFCGFDRRKGLVKASAMDLAEGVAGHAAELDVSSLCSAGTPRTPTTESGTQTGWRRRTSRTTSPVRRCTCRLRGTWARCSMPRPCPAARETPRWEDPTWRPSSSRGDPALSGGCPQLQGPLSSTTFWGSVTMASSR